MVFNKGINKKKLYFLGFLFCSKLLVAQSRVHRIQQTACERLHPFEINSFREEHLTDYIINHLLTDKKDTLFVTNRRELELVPAEYIDTDQLAFQSLGLKVIIMRKFLPFNQLGRIDSQSFGANNTWIFAINGKPSYGLSEPQDTVSRLTDIQTYYNGIEYQLPDSVVQDLYFPNFYNILYPIHPAKFYYDSLTGYHYLYLFGQRSRGHNAMTIKYFESYIAKYIFFKGTFIKRIVVPWRVLRAYQWDCDQFIGF